MNKSHGAQQDSSACFANDLGKAHDSSPTGSTLALNNWSKTYYYEHHWSIMLATKKVLLLLLFLCTCLVQDTLILQSHMSCMYTCIVH